MSSFILRCVMWSLLLTFPSVLSAQDSETDYLTFTLNPDGESYTVSAQESAEGLVAIPATYNGLPVTEIAANGFSNTGIITGLKIPSSIKKIGSKAFNGNTHLTSLYIDDLTSWLEIELTDDLSNPLQNDEIQSFFINNTKTTKLEIPEGTERIRARAFRGLSCITELIIPESVTCIGQASFSFCKGLSQLTIPESVTTIAGSAFMDCSGIKSIRIPGTVQSIGAFAFTCISLEDIFISSLDAWCSIDFDSEYANPFRNRAVKNVYVGTERLNPDLVIPESINAIKNYAFAGCPGLQSLTIPGNVTSIGEGAFIRCTSLETVDIGNSVQTILPNAFAYCDALTKVTIGRSLSAIKQNAFDECTNLAEVHISDLGRWCGIDFENSAANPLVNAHHLYLDGEELTSIVIPEGIETIGSNAFLTATSISHVSLPHTLKRIGESAFCGCKKLNAIIIPDGVTDIGDACFSGCSSLNEVSLPVTLTLIGSLCFYNCSLETLVIPGSVSRIGSSAFQYNNIKQVFLGDSINLDSYAFCNNSITDIYMTIQSPWGVYNVFDDFTPTIWLQGEEVKKVYSYHEPWHQFSALKVLVDATALRADDYTLSAEQGSTQQLSVEMLPANATLKHIFWHSSNPEIASVDHNGLVTFHVQPDTDIQTYSTRAADAHCTITASTLYHDGPTAVFQFTVTPADIDEIATGGDNPGIDYSKPYQVYNLQGVKISDSTDNLPAGVYIIRQNSLALKIMVP